MGLVLKGRRRWGKAILFLGVLSSTLLLTALIYIFKMPGQTSRDPLAPLSAEEARIRDRLATHVQTLAGDIGERNLWHFPALLAAASYIEGTLTELGYAPTDEPFESRGGTVRNILAERRGSTQAAEIDGLPRGGRGRSREPTRCRVVGPLVLLASGLPRDHGDRHRVLPLPPLPRRGRYPGPR